MDLIDNLANAFAGKEVEKVPAASIVSVALMEGMEKTGAGFPESHTNAEKMVALGESAHKYAGVESINLPFDLAIEAEAMGCTVDLRDANEHIPEIPASPFFDDLSGVELCDDFLSNGRIPVVAEACQIAREKYPDVPLISGQIGPFTLLGQIVGIEYLMKCLATNPNEVKVAVNKCADAVIEVVKAYNELDVQGDCMYEPSIAADLLPPEMFDEIVKYPLKRIADAADFNIVLHVCGDTTPILEHTLDLGYNGFSFEDCVNVKEANKIKYDLKSNTQLVGNVATDSLFKGDFESIREESFRALDRGIDILGSSCCVPPGTPLKAMEVLVKARDEYYELGKQETRFKNEKALSWTPSYIDVPLPVANCHNMPEHEERKIKI